MQPRAARLAAGFYLFSQRGRTSLTSLTGQMDFCRWMKVTSDKRKETVRGPARNPGAPFLISTQTGVNL